MAYVLWCMFTSSLMARLKSTRLILRRRPPPLTPLIEPAACRFFLFLFYFSWYCIWIPWNEMWSTICAYLSGESLWLIYELWQFRTINEIYSLWIMIYWERRKLMTNHGPAFEFNTIFLSQVVMVLFWLICIICRVIFPLVSYVLQSLQWQEFLIALAESFWEWGVFRSEVSLLFLFNCFFIWKCINIIFFILF